MLFNTNAYRDEIAKVNEQFNSTTAAGKVKMLGTQLNYFLELPNHETDPVIRKRIYEIGMALYDENMRTISNAKVSFGAKVMMTAQQVNFKHALEKMYGA